MTTAFINPAIIPWAISRRKTTYSDIAKSINVSPDKLKAWEKKDGPKPTFVQAQHLANALHIPLGYLFLSSPPKETLEIPDLRTVKDERFLKPSSEFIDLLSDVLRKADWYYEYLKDEGAKPLPFVGKYSLSDDEKDVANSISQVLGINDSLRHSVRNWEDFLSQIINSAEKAGILVLRSGIVGSNTHRPLSVDEFRGFAISNAIAPLIFINGKDAKAAQIFTLGHELAHIWIGATGISNLDLGDEDLVDEKRVEKFCNAVAAELFVPKQTFLNKWSFNSGIESNVQSLTRFFRVSSIVILRRAFDLDLISSKDFFAAYNSQAGQWKKKKAQSGGNFYANLLSRNSTPITSALVSSVKGGKVLYRDAAQLLNVQVKMIEKIAGNIGLK